MEKKNQLRSCCKNSLSSPNTHHSSSRPCGRQERGIGAAHTLYPAFAARRVGMTERVCRVARMASTAMTNGADRFSRSVIPQGFYAGYSERNVKAFTLIELLVVVLIIGILAAVALPQYQKAVEKSKATQAITMLKSVGAAMQAHHLASGTWATSFDELALDIPWTGNNKFVEASGYSQGISNQDWSLQFRKTKHNGNNIVSLVVGRISGAYAGAGFIIYFDEEYNLPEDEILCIEFKNSSPITPFAKEKGSYCEKIMKGKRKYGEHELYYTLP